MDMELDALLARGREAYRRGDLVKAELALTEALEKGAGDYADVHHLLGVVYHSWGLYSKARGAFETALRINPHYTEAALSLSITYNDLGRYTEAQEVLADVVRPSSGGLAGQLPRHEPGLLAGWPARSRPFWCANPR